jgi:hypothetical protein
MRLAAAHHAVQRLDSSFDLAQPIQEFRVLRAVILEVLLAAEADDQERGRSQGVAHPSTHEHRQARVLDLARLNSGLDFAIGEIV